MPAALVFGARNLGRAVARRLVADGWCAACVARSAETLDRLAADAPGVVGLQADARVEDDVRRVVADARDGLGGLDLVVVAISPAGGRSGGGVELAGAPAAVFDPYLDDLLPALSTVLRVAGGALAEQGHGTYVQVTGGSARRGMPGRGPWASAAFATRGMLQSAASELRGRGVHAALLVVDAVIESDKTRGFLEGKPTDYAAGEDDVAAAVAYLAAQSPRAWTHELVLTPAGDAWVP
ncbi:MAG: SDR family NAD(P)-dependent oxidoreductase [Thermoleophilia bacterium]